MSRIASLSRSTPAAYRRNLTVSILAALGTAPVIALAAPAPDPSPEPQNVEFTSAFLSGSASADLSRFEHGNPILPGQQSVDLYVNDALISRETVTFREANNDIQACFDLNLLVAAGIDTTKLEAEGHTLDGNCLDLRELIADARVHADAGDMGLHLSIPQSYLRRSARGYVDPKLWDDGVTAFTLGYSANVTNTDNDFGGNTRSGYLGLNAGLNVAGWRVRNQSYYSWNQRGGSDFTNISTYAQHDVDRLKSQLTVGDTFTSGQLFDSVGFRGVSLATDDRMLPDSMTGYAPIVRGVAETNATVEIRQAGYVIYQMSVAPGPFEISDLPAAGYGGDLQVVVTEADGRQRSFNVPFAAVPNLLRPGSWRYSAIAGELRDQNLTDAPKFVEATYQRGINNWLTGYAGLQASDGDLYRSAVVGAAFNTPIGAVSVDVSGSRVNFSEDRGSQSGYSARATYNKNIPSTNTNFALAAYRYSSQGYADLSQAAQWDDLIRNQGMNGLLKDSGVERNRFSVSMSQSLGRAGSLSLTGSRHDYWSGRDVNTSYQLGWSARWRRANFGVNAGRSRINDGSYDTTYGMTLSVPLGNDRSVSAPVLNVGTAHDTQGNRVQAGVAGVAGDRYQYSYGATGNFSDQNDDTVNLYGGWRGAYGSVNGSYTQGTGTRSQSLSAQGGLVVHPGGVTLASSLGDTMAILHADGAKGARLGDGIGKIDRRGYAITNSLMPYRLNEVSLDPKGISYDVELEQTRATVVPRAGAIIPVSFETKTGSAYVIQTTRDDGKPLPFGSEVKSAAGQVVGYVAQSGQAFVRLPDANTIALSVDVGDGTSCAIDWSPAAATKNAAGIATTSGVCRAH
ncbi:fimbria/pilus outer membrane usher protein [Lysobacter soli]|uniref:fimbria/pilus outer membrane usher protein n=1 Tax=Lysobacter soli TaxID=453783 RepID=UPI0018DC6414|nr:fimbria/pilus outer membrane usher protein [Lysobacter soli]